MRCGVNSTLWCSLFFKQKTAYEVRISDGISDFCSSDLIDGAPGRGRAGHPAAGPHRAGLVRHRLRALQPVWLCAGTDPQLARSRSRSEESRVGKECVRTCSYRWTPEYSTKHRREDELNSVFNKASTVRIKPKDQY